MSYAKNITMIAELPDLEDLEQGANNMQPPSRPQAEVRGGPDYSKFIRNARPIANEAGMAPLNRENFTQPTQPIPHHVPQHIERYDSPTGVDPMAISCIDIAKHIQNCPICSKFYANDRTGYIFTIVILSIVCILLLKRILNV